jgi:protein associated with RNAse G/E
MRMPVGARFTPAQKILVQAYKSDGHPYRWWKATVESASQSGVITFAPPGHLVEEPGGSHLVAHAIRCFYWFGKPYNLLEVYRPDGVLEEIYIHISSPPEVIDSCLKYTDLELDVVRYPGQEPFIDDEDEFEQAVHLYGYSPQLRETCYQAVRTAVELANGWNPLGYIPPLQTEDGKMD